MNDDHRPTKKTAKALSTNENMTMNSALHGDQDRIENCMEIDEQWIGNRIMKKR